jgi:hypothetical protein
MDHLGTGFKSRWLLAYQPCPGSRGTVAAGLVPSRMASPRGEHRRRGEGTRGIVEQRKHPVEFLGDDQPVRNRGLPDLGEVRGIQQEKSGELNTNPATRAGHVREGEGGAEMAAPGT